MTISIILLNLALASLCIILARRERRTGRKDWRTLDARTASLVALEAAVLESAIDAAIPKNLRNNRSK